MFLPFLCTRYLNNFLSIRDSYAPAHKLMGQICEQLKEPQKAVISYKRSLELDDKQKDVVIRVAQLHSQLPDVHMDVVKVRGLRSIQRWRAQLLLPSSQLVMYRSVGQTSQS